MFVLPMGLNGIEYSPLSNLPPVSEFGEMSINNSGLQDLHLKTRVIVFICYVMKAKC